jgi:hypothetical protein
VSINIPEEFLDYFLPLDEEGTALNRPGPAANRGIRRVYGDVTVVAEPWAGLCPVETSSEAPTGHPSAL